MSHVLKERIINKSLTNKTHYEQELNYADPGSNLLGGGNLYAQHTIEVKGHVKFLNEDGKDFKMTAYQRDGFNKNVLAETVVNPADNTYKMSITVNKPGEVVVDCGMWQSVNIWAEDENLDIDFRGADTARIKIKNPPYVYIRGGKKNELMNWINYEGYRNYQNMIAISQITYRSKFESDKDKQDCAMKLYDANQENMTAHMAYLTEHYADRSSVLAAIGYLNDEKHGDIINQALNTLEKTYPTLVADYRKAKAEAKEKRERMLPGKPLPAFEATLAGSGKKVSPADYKGKVLVLDFWASWCGPCRQEIPHLKEYYEAFKGQDVAFLSVSIDAKEDQWKKAMAEENMPWDQAIVPNAGKEVMELYQFSGIPFILVIDKEGNIYKKNVRGEAIKTAVQEVLDGKTASPAQPKSVIGGSMMMGSM